MAEPEQPACALSGAPALLRKDQETMPAKLASIVRAADRRQLDTPLLLFLASSRPLAFVTGQLFYVVAPLAGLLGRREIESWAAWLSDPALPTHPTALPTDEP